MARIAGRLLCCSAAAILWLSSCSTLPHGGPRPADQAVAAAPIRPYHQAIEIGGRLSVRYEQNGSEQSLHGSFSWQQDGAHTGVTLLSPLGQTVATINATPDGATLQRGGQAPLRAADVDALTVQALGWPLPVSGMREWLQGYGTDSTQRRFVALPLEAPSVLNTHDGWRVRYADWQTAGEPVRPRRIDLERDTMQAGTVSIRIVIDSWQPHSSPN
jgi:outer membrane lipoprotein LolB